FAEDKNDRLPELAAELVRRQVTVIAASATTAGARCQAATTTIPIAFIAAQDPVRLGLVGSLARPGGNATGINFFSQELVSQRLGLRHELVPKAARVAVLANPANAPSAETTLRAVPEAARAIGLQIQVLNASPAGKSRRPSSPSCATGLMPSRGALHYSPESIGHAGGARPDTHELLQP